MSNKHDKSKSSTLAGSDTATLYATPPEGLPNGDGWESLAGVSESGKTAKTTQQYDELEALMNDFSDSFMKVSRAMSPWRGSKLTEADKSILVQEVQTKGQAVLDKLQFEFENPLWEKALGKYMRRVKNFRKLLQAFVDANDWESLKSAYEENSSKSKEAWHKFIEYRNEALDVVKAVDVEVEHRMTVAGFNVALMTAARDDWDSEAVDRVKWVLEQATQLMSKHGFGQSASGTVLAYPTKYLPMSSGGGGGSALAKYRLGGVIWIAAGWDNPKSILKSMIHELGHKVYFEVMGSQGRNAWSEFYDLAQGPPDVNAMLADWNRYVDAAQNEGDAARRRHLPFYYSNLKGRDAELAAWTLIVAQKFDISAGEKLDRYERPAKTSRPALDELESKKSEIKVFLYPVTAYSATSAEELFAEVFAHYIVLGPRTIQGIVRDQFRRALPMMRGASAPPATPAQVGFAKHLFEQAVRGGWAQRGEVLTEEQLGSMDRVDIAELISSLKARKPFTVVPYAGGGYKLLPKNAGWSMLADGAHSKSIALMKFLSQVSRRLGVAEHVYVVGGAVRNFVIDRPIKDIDVVIDAVALGGRKDSDWFAQQVARAIPTMTNLTTNQYGVAILTVKGSWDLEGQDLKGEVIEIANARKESYGGGEGKGYKPSEVVPATIEEDVYRREFTFNTLLWRMLDLAHGPDKAEIIDLTGCGLRDLQNRVLTCPRDPDVVFSDDPTRLMRVIKFVAKYGFTIPDDVAASIKRNAGKMKQAPWEAIGTLLVENVLNEPTARDALKLMKKLGLLDVVAEMVQEQKAFASYLSRQLNDRNVQLLLDLMDLGLDVKSPIAFLDRVQQQRLREITVAMSEEEALAFLAALRKPPVDNQALISMFSIPAQERGALATAARQFMLSDPALASNPRGLQQAMGRELGKKFRTGSALGRKVEKHRKLGRPGIWFVVSDTSPAAAAAELGVPLVHVRTLRNLGGLAESGAVVHGFSDLDDPVVGAQVLNRGRDALRTLQNPVVVWLPSDLDLWDSLQDIFSWRAGAMKLAQSESESEFATEDDWAKLARSYIRIAMFDFDGTLFKSWEKTPTWWAGTELDKGPFSFFVNPESLDEPCVPERPDASFWISPSVQAAQKAVKDAGTFVVIITGRVGVHRERVTELLGQRGIRPDKMYFNPGMSAATFKVAVLRSLLAAYNTVDEVVIWENENEKTYEAAVLRAGEALERELEVEINRVDVPPKALECGPQDFGISARTAAQTGTGSKVGLFIRVPEELALEFPPRGPEDTSPPHVTFLYVGAVPATRRGEFLDIVRGELGAFGKVRAAFDGPDSFPQPGDDRRVHFVRTKFDRDMGSLRDRVSGKLTDAGFEVLNAFPLAYTPHATLAYTDGLHSPYKGHVPDGSWEVSEIEVWGLPQVEQIKLGSILTHVCKSVRTASVSVLPVSDPIYNHREIAKQMILLEDHLFQPRKRCMDCIRKHLLTIEALAEEAVTLVTDEVDPKWALVSETMAEAARMAQVNVERGEDLTVIARGIRNLRKGLIKTLYAPGSKLIDMIDMSDEKAGEYLGDIQTRAKTAALDLATEDDWMRLATNPVDRTVERTEVVETPASWIALAGGGAKFKDKKQVDKADGSGKTTVYEYSDRQVALRNRDKAKRVEKLRKSIGKLRKQVTKDLDAKDPATRLTALAIALIDATFERVGNDGSAKEGHFGVTGWTVDHVTFKGSKATFEYVGKSGVKQSKTVEDPKIVSALKAATKGKGKGDKVLCEGDECTITSADVNSYLEPYDVTAKDLRGFHANDQMQAQLRAVRSKGKKLPTDPKAKKELLKKEFQTALDATAALVGHEPSTLKSQYLVPGLEDEYMKDGDVSDKLDKRGSTSWGDLIVRPMMLTPSTTWREASASDLGAKVELCDLGTGRFRRASVPTTSRALVDTTGAYLVYTPTHAGNKIERIGAQSQDAKREVVAKLLDLLQEPGWYAEGAHRLGTIIEKAGLHPVDDEVAVREVLRANLKWLGDGHYVRDREGGPVENALYGHPQTPRVGGFDLDAYFGSPKTASRSKTAAFDVLGHCPHCQCVLHDGPRFFMACDDCGYNFDPVERRERPSREVEWVALAPSDPRIALLDTREAKQRAWSNAFFGRAATKSESEKEDEEVRDLVKPSPKVKPPRQDLRKQRLDEDDPDLKEDEQDRKDKSRNWKDGSEKDEDDEDRPDFPLREFPYDSRLATWADWARLAAEEKRTYDDYVAEAEREGKKPIPQPEWEEAQRAGRGEDDEPADGSKGDGEEDKGKQLPEAFAKKFPDLDAKSVEEFAKGMDPNMSDKALFDAFLDKMEDELPEGGELPQWVGDMTAKDFGKLVDGMTGDARAKHKKEQAEAKAEAKRQKELAVKVKTDPTFVGGQEMTSDDEPTDQHDQAALSARAETAYNSYSAADEQTRAAALGKMQEVLKDSKPGSPRHEEAKAILNGIALASHVKDDKPIEGIPQPPGALRKLQKQMVAAGKAGLVTGTATNFSQVQSREAIDSAMQNMLDDELVEYVGRDEPMSKMAAMLTDPNTPEDYKRMARRMIRMSATAQMSVMAPLLREMGETDAGTADKRLRELTADADFTDALALMEQGSGDAEKEDSQGVAAAFGALAQVFLDKVSEYGDLPKNSKYVKVLKALAKGDVKALKAKWVGEGESEEDPTPPGSGSAETSAPPEGSYEEYVQQKKDDGEEPLSKEKWEARTDGQAAEAPVDTPKSKAASWVDHYGVDPWPDF